jgi:hypothetical protein
MAESGTEVRGRFVGPENVERSRAYLERHDPELHHHITRRPGTLWPR